MCFGTAAFVDEALWLRRLSLCMPLLASAVWRRRCFFFIRAPHEDAQAIAVVQHAFLPSVYVHPPDIRSARIGKIRLAFTQLVESIRAPLSQTSFVHPRLFTA